MKKNYFFVFVVLLSLNLSLYSQNKSDKRQILQRLIEANLNDSSFIYYKYRNSDAIEDFERFQNLLELEKYGAYNVSGKKSKASDDFAELTRHFKNDSIDLVIKSLDNNDGIDSENIIKFDYEKTIKDLKKKDNKRFKFGFIVSIKKRLRNQAIVFYSTPILSSDQKYSIIYKSYIFGPLNAGGSIILLKKENGKWIIIDYIYTWIS